MFEKLVEVETYAKSLEEKVNENYEAEPAALIAYFNNNVREIKKNL